MRTGASLPLAADAVSDTSGPAARAAGAELVGPPQLSVRVQEHDRDAGLVPSRSGHPDSGESRRKEDGIGIGDEIRTQSTFSVV